MKPLLKQEMKVNNKKNVRSAAKKRNNNAKDYDAGIEECNFLELIGNESIEKENLNKKYGFEELYADFEKSLQLYTYLGLRQRCHPLFLKRNLSYFNVNPKKSLSKKKTVDQICSDLLKKSNNQRHNIKSFTFTFLSFELTFNEQHKEQQQQQHRINSKKKVKLDNSRRSIGNKTFIEIYYLNNKNEMILLGKCDISNIIDTKTTTTKSNQIELYVENNFQFSIEFKAMLFFRIIYTKDIEIEFTNTFNLSIDLFKNQDHQSIKPNGIFVLNMHEMSNDNQNKSYSSSIDYLNEYKNSKNLFQSLPTIKFKLKLELVADECIKLKPSRKGKISETNFVSHSSSSSISSIYHSPLTSPIIDRKKLNINNIKANKSTNKLSNNNIELYYQFIGKKNLKLLTKVDKNEIYVCQFCFLNCKCFDSLLKHLTCNHFRFQIECIPSTINSTVNKIQFNISINELYNGSYTGNCYDALSPYGYSLSRYKPTRRISCCLHFFYKKANLDITNDIDTLNDARGIFNMNGLERLFYHTRTCQPVDQSELNENLIDSDNELDPEWLKEQTDIFIQEFADVNQGEKEIMRLWNLHIIHNNYISDAQVFNACESFIEKTGSYIIQNNLINNFYLHLANLNDYGLLEASKITKLSDLLLSKATEFKR